MTLGTARRSAVHVAAGPRFNSVDRRLAEVDDSRNRALFADRGLRHTLSLGYVLGAQGALLGRQL